MLLNFYFYNIHPSTYFIKNVIKKKKYTFTNLRFKIYLLITKK